MPNMDNGVILRQSKCISTSVFTRDIKSCMIIIPIWCIINVDVHLIRSVSSLPILAHASCNLRVGSDPNSFKIRPTVLKHTGLKN